MAEEPSAVLLIHVWLEGDEGAFRARLSGIGAAGGDETPEERTVAVAASPEDVVVAVERWLTEFVRSGRVDPGR